MEIIESNKGAHKLCNAGYCYTKKRYTKSTVHWICSERAGGRCKGSLITNAAVTLIQKESPHTHPPNYSKIVAAKMRAEIKAGIEEYVGHPNQIVLDLMHKYDADVMAIAGNPDSLRKMIQRKQERQKIGLAKPTDFNMVEIKQEPVDSTDEASKVIDNNRSISYDLPTVEENYKRMCASTEVKENYTATIHQDKSSTNYKRKNFEVEPRQAEANYRRDVHNYKSSETKPNYTRTFRQDELPDSTANYERKLREDGASEAEINYERMIREKQLLIAKLNYMRKFSQGNIAKSTIDYKRATSNDEPSKAETKRKRTYEDQLPKSMVNYTRTFSEAEVHYEGTCRDDNSSRTEEQDKRTFNDDESQQFQENHNKKICHDKLTESTAYYERTIGESESSKAEETYERTFKQGDDTGAEGH